MQQSGQISKIDKLNQWIKAYIDGLNNKQPRTINKLHNKNLCVCTISNHLGQNHTKPILVITKNSIICRGFSNLFVYIEENKTIYSCRLEGRCNTTGKFKQAFLLR